MVTMMSTRYIPHIQEIPKETEESPVVRKKVKLGPEDAPRHRKPEPSVGGCNLAPGAQALNRGTTAHKAQTSKSDDDTGTYVQQALGPVSPKVSRVSADAIYDQGHRFTTNGELHTKKRLTREIITQG